MYNLKVCKSVGPDGVHPRLLKELSNHLCKPLARLFNNSQAYLRRVIEKRRKL